MTSRRQGPGADLVMMTVMLLMATDGPQLRADAWTAVRELGRFLEGCGFLLARVAEKRLDRILGLEDEDLLTAGLPHQKKSS